MRKIGSLTTSFYRKLKDSRKVNYLLSFCSCRPFKLTTKALQHTILEEVT